jgi:D-alanine-D-alanine ligase
VTGSGAPMRVAVLLGGLSSEREISLMSGGAAADALEALGHDVTRVDVGRDVARVLSDLAPDAAFVALHGKLGEDGVIQGVLTLLGIPFTGSNIAASACAFDKVVAKGVLRASGVPTPAMQLIPAGAPVQPEMAFPLVVKPRRGGSSIGISTVKGREALDAAVAEARAEDPDVYLEAAVPGREVTVSVLDGEPLPIVEIVPAAGIFSFAAKYTDAGTRYIVPADLPPACADAIREASVATYRALGCAGAARVDLMLDDALDPWVLEINTVPGLTRKSLLPKAAAAAGMTFDDLVARMLAGARVEPPA